MKRALALALVYFLVMGSVVYMAFDTFMTVLKNMN